MYPPKINIKTMRADFSFPVGRALFLSGDGGFPSP